MGYDTEPVEVKADLDIVADLATRAADPKPLVNGALGVIVPAGAELRTIEPDAHAAHPARKRGTVRLATVDALIAYVTRHRTEGTELYVHPTSGRVVAVLDDHAEEAAGHGQHRAELNLLTTDEWAFWAANDGKLLTQQAFAEHVEDGGRELIEPDPATMLELATSFHAKSKVNFRQASRLDNGNVQLTYEEDTTASAGAKGQLTVPTEFKLAIAPFVGEERYAVSARLRWQLRDGQLTLGYKLDRPDAVVRDALGGVAARLAEQFEHVYTGEAR